MKLFINTSDSENIEIKVGQKHFVTESKNKKGQALLPFIVSTLEEESIKLTDISEIEVNTGPGSFTGIRVGVSVANALGWSMNIPVNGKDVSKEFIQINYTSNH